MTKRAFDITCAALALIAGSPLILVAALLVKLQDGGPVFYRGTRIGTGSKLFHIIKFRTMVVNADQLGGSCTAADDPRITKLGRTLRRYKIDELPQLINVLLGDMSIVGPRPDTPDYAAKLSPEQAALIFSVRPGITDWATLWNSDEEGFLKGRADPEDAYKKFIWPRKIALQIDYVQRRSFMADIKIILHTLMVVATRHRPKMFQEHRLTAETSSVPSTSSGSAVRKEGTDSQSKRRPHPTHTDSTAKFLVSKS